MGGAGSLVRGTVISIWRTEYIYVLSDLGRALHLLRGEGILVWNSVTSIDTWRTDYMYVLFVLKRTLHPVGGAGSLVRGDSH